MPNLGIGELALIAVVLLLLFGARRLPEIGRSIGRSVHEFKKGFEHKDPPNEDQQENPAGHT